MDASHGLTTSWGQASSSVSNDVEGDDAESTSSPIASPPTEVQKVHESETLVTLYLEKKKEERRQSRNKNLRQLFSSIVLFQR